MSKDAKKSGLATRLRAVITDRDLKQEQIADLMRKAIPGIEFAEMRSKISQQTVSYILARGAEDSSYTPLLAAALNLPPLWLAYGYGPDPLEKRNPPTEEQQTERERQLLRAFHNVEEPVRRAIENALGVNIKANKTSPPKKQATSRKTVSRVA